MDNPQVSIITPTFNSRKYLKECIESVVMQNQKGIEHIFIDGGSSDGTLDMIFSYQTNYPQTIKFISAPGSTAGEATNLGMDLAKGSILGWLGSDDFYEPDAIKTIIEFFEVKPEAFFVFGECNITDEKGKIIIKSPTKEFNLKEVINTAAVNINLASAFYRREVIERLGMFNLEMSGMGSDFELYIRLNQVYKFYRIEKPLSNFRLHANGANMTTNPATRKLVRERRQKDYTLRRQFGASAFSSGSRKYFLFLIVDRLRLYRFINHITLNKMRNYPLINKALRILGI